MTHSTQKDSFWELSIRDMVSLPFPKKRTFDFRVHHQDHYSQSSSCCQMWLVMVQRGAAEAWPFVSTNSQPGWFRRAYFFRVSPRGVDVMIWTIPYSCNWTWNFKQYRYGCHSYDFRYGRLVLAIKVAVENAATRQSCQEHLPTYLIPSRFLVESVRYAHHQTPPGSLYSLLRFSIEQHRKLTIEENDGLFKDYFPCCSATRSMQ